MSDSSSMFPPSLRNMAKPEKETTIGVYLGALILIPVLMTVFWNYGATEVIEALGGPDANVGIVAGMLATYFYSGLLGIAKRGLA